MMIHAAITLNSNNWRSKMCSIRKSELETIIEGLEDAISICQSVDSSEDYERSYPYATGYSYATMQHAITNLRQILNA
tara:strand:- start:1466 stop:1699 length:234 start_codon:yes stop_codon:yes gene_type:complete